MKRLETGDWTQFRKLPHSVELDFHSSEQGPREVPYGEAMGEVGETAQEAIRRAYEIGLKYVIFTHGHSTSRRGETTARSQVRQLIKSQDATPYILRRDCIQHFSCFVVAIRENPSSQLPQLACPRCESVELKPAIEYYII